MRQVSLTETENKTLPHRIVYKVDPSQSEEKKVEEGNDGYDVTVVRQAVRQDGTMYSDSFRSVYDAVDTVITYKDAKQMEKDKKAAEKPAAPSGGDSPAGTKPADDTSGEPSRRPA